MKRRGWGCLWGYFVAALRFTPKKWASGARIQNFSLNLIRYDVGLHFGVMFANFSVVCLTLRKWFPFIPASHLSALVQGKEQSGCFFSGNLPRTSTGLRQHISQWGKQESVWAVYSQTVPEDLIPSRTCRPLTRARLFKPAPLSCSINTNSVSMDTLNQSHMKIIISNRSKLHSSACIIIITAHTPLKCVLKVVFSKYKEYFKRSLNHRSKATE